MSEKQINVASVCDGISTARLALDRAGVRYDNYYASEIDKYAIKVAQHNYPDTVQLGNLNDWRNWNLDGIDLYVGGTSCQDLSRMKIDGKGLEGEQSKLFYTYYDCLQHYSPEYFLLENVVMKEVDQKIITDLLGVEPLYINSAHFSAQDRPRLYWTNINVDMNLLPNNDLVTRDIMESNVDEKYYYEDEFEIWNGLDSKVVGQLQRKTPEGKRRFMDITSRVYNPEYKMACLTAVGGGHQEKKVYDNGRTRKLTPLEYERLQTMPDGWTDIVSNSQRYKQLGNGWTCDTISWILSFLPNTYKK